MAIFLKFSIEGLKKKERKKEIIAVKFFFDN